MIGISKLYCGTVEASDSLRYGRRSGLPAGPLQSPADKKPVVVWNATALCNLNCVHCYSLSGADASRKIMTYNEEKSLIGDLAEFGVPALLFSGGEPLMHPRIFDLMDHAVKSGMRTALSTNGTLMDRKAAERLKSIGISYVGISIDGLGATHDRFRNRDGAFRAAMEGVRRSLESEIKVGLRFTLTKDNFMEINGVFDLLKTMGIHRICFYHLAYSGRGAKLRNSTLSNQETRQAIDLIISRTSALHGDGFGTEVLTVNNHCDGIYIYLKSLRENPAMARRILSLLKINGGNSSGIGIGCINWDGDVYPDQFWRTRVLGNVRRNAFSRIWSGSGNAFLNNLRDRRAMLKGRCGECHWQDLCNGNSRSRAEAVYNDPWAQEPACYLSDEEIHISRHDPEETADTL
jgi:radical SAM protein with 4Fe4S-binding SPASM domain